MRRLFLFANFYPYSHRENFLEDEINYLASEFDVVYLVPYYCDNSVREYPNNCVLIPSEEPYPNKLKVCFNSKTIIPFLRELLDFRVFKSIKNIKRLIFDFFQINHVLSSRRIKTILTDLSNQDVLYFYWGVGFNSIAAIIKGRSKMVSRFHGHWDLWEEEYDGYVPFRKKILTNLDATVLISSKGDDFIKQKYPYAKRFFFPLGSRDYGLCLDDSISNSIRVVSCSEVYPLKRVDLIFRSLLEMKDKKIIWTHLGGGVDFDKIREMANMVDHPNLEVVLKGRVSHNEVVDYFINHRFDVFVNLSTSEGVPVSIMEAISFNIPIVATDVGGTSDVVPPECGLLVSPNPSEKEVSDCILKVLEGHYSPRRFWEEHYSAARNYGNFARFIKEL